MRTVTVREARANLVKLSEEINRTRQPIIVAEQGRWPLLVLLGYEA
jgi:PHD/YefM family antitoxin component YafN of YafNO toxin-antitoxin module